MKRRNLSVDGLAQAVGLSKTTAERLLRGNATSRTLQLLADFLDVDRSDLFTSQKMVDLTGLWYALYKEQESPFKPYCVTEQLVLKQEGAKLSGTYHTIEQEHPQDLLERRAFTLSGEVKDRFVLGTYQRHIEDPDYPRGSGTFHLKFARADHWLEGYCTFFSDDEMIACSLNIWIRQEIPNAEKVLEQAKMIMQGEDAFALAPRSIPR